MMITPAGVECRYYYEDYFRGRERKECRLIAQNPHSDPWQPDLCQRCPVPGILRANGSPYLVLEGQAERRFFGLSKRVSVTAVCSKHLAEVPEPHVGCSQCLDESPGAAILRMG